MKARNQPVGTCACPIDPAHTCDVYQFAARAKTEAGKRKAGKFYIDCRDGHGRLGFDGSAWIQEHVLEHITWSAERPPEASAPAAPAARAIPALQPASSSRAAARAAPRSTSPGKQTGTQTQTQAPAKRAWWEDL